MGSELGLTATSKPYAVLDAVSIFWLCFGGVWTLLVVSGLAFLIVNRRLCLVKMRGLGLTLISITFLHLYLLSVEVAYTIRPLLPGQYQFWIMATWLPFGLAFFHASNSRLLVVAKSQQRYALPDSVPRVSRCSRRKSPRAFFRELDCSMRMLVVVIASLSIQLILTIFMYLLSRKFHPSFGIAGTEVHGTPIEQKAAMGTGWEWWPTIVGQFFWSWIVAPYVLWKARNIDDTRGWRLQTTACCLAGLPATPLWLIGVYVPALSKLGQYWIPPQWIVLSIIVIEVFTVFLPCWEIIRARHLKQETLQCIARWEIRKGNSNPDTDSLDSGSTMAGSVCTDSYIMSRSEDQVMTMGALEHILELDPEPLQRFSALRDFSGENIAFLKSIREWKTTLQTYDKYSEDDRVRERFNGALRIYAEYVSPRDAEFPVNLYHRELRNLETIFEPPMRMIFGERTEYNTSEIFSAPRPTSSDPEKRVMTTSSEETQILSDLRFWGPIPEKFNEMVFDECEKSVKYLVLTNTWPKYVRERKDSMESN